jgi:hypothetical protein
MVTKPHPEETIEAPELRSLGSAAKQGELLPERQVFEREVGAGLERRMQGAQKRKYEGHCLHGSHAAGPSSSLWDELLANDTVRVLSAARSAPNRASTRDIALHGSHAARPSSSLGIEFWQTTTDATDRTIEAHMPCS